MKFIFVLFLLMQCQFGNCQVVGFAQNEDPEEQPICEDPDDIAECEGGLITNGNGNNNSVFKVINIIIEQQLSRGSFGDQEKFGKFKLK